MLGAQRACQDVDGSNDQRPGCLVAAKLAEHLPEAQRDGCNLDVLIVEARS